jgi:hypothetical protein
MLPFVLAFVLSGAEVSAAAIDCRTTLAADPVAVTPGCWIDEKGSGRSALLTWKCGGGTATAEFGVPFVGTVGRTGNVSLSALTTFPWEDGCTWTSEQRIEGALSSRALRYTYIERPIKGTSCLPARCTGTATVRVE